MIASMLTMLLAAVADPLATLPDASDTRLAALITDTRMAEISGLAASRRHPDLLWAHNDSGDGAVLHALGTDGVHRGQVTLRGIEAIDIEDMAGFELDGEPYLLVADVGDNGGVRRELRLHVIREPAALTVDQVEVEWTLEFRWPDGPRDCEAVAVDAARGQVLLISKKRVPPELFVLPLRGSGKRTLVAEPVGTLAGIVQPDDEDLRRNPTFGRYRAQISAADVSADGDRLAVLNYRSAHVFERRGEEGWAVAVARPPRIAPFPWLAQAEAIAFDRDGHSLWIGTEHLPAPLLRLSPTAAD